MGCGIYDSLNLIFGVIIMLKKVSPIHLQVRAVFYIIGRDAFLLSLWLFCVDISILFFFKDEIKARKHAYVKFSQRGEISSWEASPALAYIRLQLFPSPSMGFRQRFALLMFQYSDNEWKSMHVCL